MYLARYYKTSTEAMHNIQFTSMFSKCQNAFTLLAN